MDLISLLPEWPVLKEFGNSNFTTAIIGSLMGAFAGAYGAQVITERAKVREALLAEIRHTNRAIILSFNICNTLLSLKKQHIKDLADGLRCQQVGHADMQVKNRAGQLPPGSVFQIELNLKSFNFPLLPITTLQSLIFDQISVAGKSIALVDALSRSIHGLNEAIELRNSLINKFKSGEYDQIEICNMYLGIPIDGGVNQEYPDALDGISSYCDDGIYFSKLLCELLCEHGERVRGKGNRAVRRVAPVISNADFRNAVELLPDENNYVDWRSGFAAPEQVLNFRGRCGVLFNRVFPNFGFNLNPPPKN